MQPVMININQNNLIQSTYRITSFNFSPGQVLNYDVHNIVLAFVKDENNY
jgi:hypothetical protein